MIFLLRRRILFIVFSILIIVSVTLCSVLIDSYKFVYVDSKARKIPIYCVKTSEKKIAVTFDCAWENSDTDILLEILKKENAKATFYITGDWCERYPEDVKKIFAEGHEIGNHSYSHPHINSLSREEIVLDTQKCNNILNELIGTSPATYRAPYGEYNDTVISTVEEELGQKVIQWNIDSLDWKKTSSDIMVEKILKKAECGSIVLFHNDTKNTPNALRQILPILKGEGYQFVTVSELIYKDNYAIDNSGKQCKIK